MSSFFWGFAVTFFEPHTFGNLTKTGRSLWAHIFLLGQRADLKVGATLPLGSRGTAGQHVNAGAPSGGCFKAGRMSPLAGLHVLTATFHSHGYAVG